jgi:hypothetical protein
VIIIVADQIDLGRYIAVYQRVHRDLSRNERVAHLDWNSTDLSTIDPNATLFISAHGSETEIEKNDPEQLAAKLINKGLTNQVPLKKIKLMVCSSGSTKDTTVPYCQRLAKALADNGGPKKVMVVGFDGESSVTDERGSQHGLRVDQSNMPHWKEFKGNYKATYDRWNDIAEKLPCGSHAEFMKNAESLYSEPEVNEIFKYLYRTNAEYYLPKHQGKVYSDKTDRSNDKSDFLPKEKFCCCCLF